MFNVDGSRFDFPCDLERSVKLESSSNSGLMLNKQYFNDVIASYVSYTVKIAIPQGQENDYARLFELLSKPVGEHLWVFPYNQTLISFYGKIDSISDKFYRKVNGRNIWRNISFSVTATRPKEEEVKVWLIGQSLENCSTDLTDGYVVDGQGLSFTISPDAGYEMSEVAITMDNINITEDVYDEQTGEVEIESVTGDINIVAIAVVVNNES